MCKSLFFYLLINSLFALLEERISEVENMALHHGN